MFAHVLALCFILRLLKRSNHYVPQSFRFAVTFLSVFFRRLCKILVEALIWLSEKLYLQKRLKGQKVYDIKFFYRILELQGDSD